MSTAAYENLEKKFERISHLNHLVSICSWDEAAMMPTGGGQARGDALATAKGLIAELMHAPDLAELLEEAEQQVQDLGPWQAANLREMRHSWKLANSVSPDLVALSARAQSRCEQAWRSMRAKNDWEGLKPYLEEVVRLAREEAQQRAASTGLKPYDAMIDCYEPGESEASLEARFDQLKAFLPGFLQQVLEAQKSRQFPSLKGPFAIVEQQTLGHEVMEAVGFDFTHGRLDVSHHPFCGGVPQDVRLTTRYTADNFTESLMGVIHETGHARYEQGLPREWLSQPVGRARSMGVHESQSLLFEMQVGRSRDFLHFVGPLLGRHFGSRPEWNEEDLFTLYSRVEPGYIRVNADELTYPLHVILRFELERELIGGTLEVSDLPEAWDAKMQSSLGLSTKGRNNDGCMQDVHWMAGIFGYFPSYTLGAMLAAQLFAAAERAHPGLRQQIREGNFDTLSTWLSENIWSKGSLLSTSELIKAASGEELNPQHFMDYLSAKYMVGSHSA